MGTPWAMNLVGSGYLPTSSAPRWRDLVESHRVTHHDMYLAFRKWHQTRGIGKEAPTQQQFTRQMGIAFESRLDVSGMSRKRLRSPLCDGRRDQWEIMTLKEERSSFSLLHRHITFDEDRITDQGTRPINSFVIVIDDDRALSQRIPSLCIDGLDEDEEMSSTPSQNRRRPN